jgi:hypothetical protein
VRRGHSVTTDDTPGPEEPVTGDAIQ